MGHAKSGITGDSLPAVQNVRDRVGWHIEMPREFSSTHTQLLQFLCRLLTDVNL
jgi:hypothetical protein